MGSIVLDDFKIGLDKRRMTVTSLPGSLVKCENAHITRGAEIEKAEAFTKLIDLPEETFGLKAIRNKFMVFGSIDYPSILNANPLVKYSRLNPTGGTHSWGSFDVTGQVSGDLISSILVGTTELLAASVTCTATVADFPKLVSAAINANSSTSGYKSFYNGNKIYIHASAIGTASNTKTITVTKTGTIAISNLVAFSGGQVATNPKMIAVHKVELFGGIPYVIAEYDDAFIRHWYDGKIVEDMTSCRATGKFKISSSGVVSAKSAEGSFLIVESTNSCTFNSITVGTTELLTEPFTYNSLYDELGLENKIVEEINKNSSVTGFSAYFSTGNKISIKADIAGLGYNGLALAVSASGVNIQDIHNLSGGVDAAKITAVTVNAVNLLSVEVPWVDSDRETARALTESINDLTGTHGYESYLYGTTVYIKRTSAGTSANGHALEVVAGTGINITDKSLTVNGGEIYDSVREPGFFAKTYKHKMYELTGPTLNYSAVGVPTEFDSGTGDGFDNLSNTSSGSENLQAMETYFNYVAIFSDRQISVWFLSDDPNENQLIQILNNIGTIAPDSVCPYGDSDVFFLNETGIRSLRARDSSNAAYVNDVGTAIDTIIQNEILKNNFEAIKAKGLMEPRDGRFLMAIGSTIFVFSYFPTGKISAWSTYNPGFKVTGADYIGQTLIFRSEDALYQLGGSTVKKYNFQKTKIITPFLPTKDPAVIKDFTGIDIACEGTWDIYVNTDLSSVDEDGNINEDSFELVGTITGTTYNDDGGPSGHFIIDSVGSHIALKFVNRTNTYARIGNVEIHYPDGGEKE